MPAVPRSVYKGLQLHSTIVLYCVVCTLILSLTFTIELWSTGNVVFPPRQPPAIHPRAAATLFPGMGQLLLLLLVLAIFLQLGSLVVIGNMGCTGKLKLRHVV